MTNPSRHRRSLNRPSRSEHALSPERLRLGKKTPVSMPEREEAGRETLLPFLGKESRIPPKVRCFQLQKERRSFRFQEKRVRKLSGG